MPVCNVVDRRERTRYDVDVMVIFEDSWHDNTCEGATQFPEGNEDDDHSDGDVSYLGVEHTTVELAIRYAAQRWPTQAVTLFLYDVGADNYSDASSFAFDPADGSLALVPMPTVQRDAHPVSTTSPKCP